LVAWSVTSHAWLILMTLGCLKLAVRIFRQYMCTDEKNIILN
jgi:hypothetical protein